MNKENVTILDLGEQFGLGCGEVFSPWNCNVIRVQGLNHFDELLKAYAKSRLVAVFGGGADIHPSIYKHDNAGSSVGPSKSRRDVAEIMMFNSLRKFNVSMLGICRGAQLLCAMSGGFLLQDVAGHGRMGGHDIVTRDGKTINMSSLHHQMMVPMKVNHELIAWSVNQTRGHALWDARRVALPAGFFEKEPEIVFFPETRSLAVQGHPEFMRVDSEATEYTRNLVESYLL